MEFEDHYRTLGVEREAEPDEVNRSCSRGSSDFAVTGDRRGIESCRRAAPAAGDGGNVETKTGRGATKMSTLNQLRDGLTRAWETVSGGWRELVERAGDALTRFHPKHSGGEIETRDERIAERGARWGVLAAEMKVDDDEVVVDIEVPGMEADDFQIRVVDDVLVVHGEKKVQRERKEGHFHVMERAYGAFERAVRLPVPVEESAARASYKRGVLHVALPRSEAHKARRIEVKRG